MWNVESPVAGWRVFLSPKFRIPDKQLTRASYDPGQRAQSESI